MNIDIPTTRDITASPTSQRHITKIVMSHAEQYRMGEITVREIAEKYGILPSSIRDVYYGYDFAREHNVMVHAKQYINDVSYSVDVIATKTGYEYGYIKSIFKKYCVKRCVNSDKAWIRSKSNIHTMKLRRVGSFARYYKMGLYNIRQISEFTNLTYIATARELSRLKCRQLRVYQRVDNLIDDGWTLEAVFKLLNVNCDKYYKSYSTRVK